MFGICRNGSMSSELNEIRRARNQFERMTHQLMEKLQTQIDSLSTQLKSRMQKLEMDNRITVTNNAFPFGHFTVFSFFLWENFSRRMGKIIITAACLHFWINFRFIFHFIRTDT